MPEIKWIKLNVDMFDDEKIKIIQSMPEGDSLLVIWIKLITLAGKTNDSGYIYIADNIPYTEEMLSVIMNKPLLTIRLAIDTFTKLQMIEADTKGIYLVNFEKHQSIDKMAQLKEQNRLRKQRERERKKLMSRNVTLNVTQCHATDIEEDKERDKEKEKSNKKKKASKVFVPPTFEEVQAYCASRGNKVDAKKFFDFYDAGNWIDSKGNQVKNWKQKVITWESNIKDDQQRKVGANGITISNEKSELEGVF
jgi:predicted phage replisome organizer